MNLYEAFLSAQIAANGIEGRVKTCEALNDSETRNFINTIGGFNGQIGNSVNRGGISCTCNGDGTYTLDGTASSAVVMVFNTYTGATTNTKEGSDEKKHIPTGKYIGTCDPENRVKIQIGKLMNGTRSVGSINHGQKFEIFDNYDEIWVRLIINANSTFNNEVIYPMIRPADVADDTFKPYAPSNYELYKMLLSLGSANGASLNSVMSADNLSDTTDLSDTGSVTADATIEEGDAVLADELQGC